MAPTGRWRWREEPAEYPRDAAEVSNVTGTTPVMPSEGVNLLTASQRVSATHRLLWVQRVDKQLGRPPRLLAYPLCLARS